MSNDMKIPVAAFGALEADFKKINRHGSAWAMGTGQIYLRISVSAKMKKQGTKKSPWDPNKDPNTAFTEVPFIKNEPIHIEHTPDRPPVATEDLRDPPPPNGGGKPVPTGPQK